MTGRLETDAFLEVVRNAPLVSIDLIVDRLGRTYLLGQRLNPPARGWWFVPGGRIHKGETIPAAVERVAATELGTSDGARQARFLGVYEHFYDENAAGHPGFGTHYVVLAFGLSWNQGNEPHPDRQHARFRWAEAAEITADESVHPYTRAYFERPPWSSDGPPGYLGGS